MVKFAAGGEVTAISKVVSEGDRYVLIHVVDQHLGGDLFVSHHVYSCWDCGSAVTDPEKHDRWHERVAREGL